MAEKRPELLRSPEVARSLKQSLIEAIVGCVEEADGPVPDRAGRSHHAIMQRFKRVLEEEPDRALYIPELCAGVGAPERTLRLCCQEHLGLSPKQFLILRRMQLARRALLSRKRRLLQKLPLDLAFGTSAASLRSTGSFSANCPLRLSRVRRTGNSPHKVAARGAFSADDGWSIRTHARTFDAAPACAASNTPVCATI